MSTSLTIRLITIDKLSNISYTKNVPMRYEKSHEGVYLMTIQRYPTVLGEGILSQTRHFPGSSDIIEQVDARTGQSIYFVQSDRFAGRYYLVCQRPNGWYFSGDDRLAARYIAKVEAMREKRQAHSAA